MNIIHYILLLLSMVILLNAHPTWLMGLGYQKIMEEMMKSNESNLTNDVEKWIVQPLDHFNDKEERTWQMRYFESLDHFERNGPIYLLIGGEAAIFRGMYKCSILEEIAKETRGAIITSEHRYYGASNPLDNSKTENLKYLSSEQALADLAYLIKFIKSQPRFGRSKVVALGGSYPGNLAAWMRAKYPEVVDCAWASSAPVLAKKDFFEYNEQVGEDFMKFGGKQCYEKINQKFTRYHKLFQTTEGIKQLKKENNICEETDMTKPLNKAYFIDTMMKIYQGTAQYGPISNIEGICNNMTETVLNSIGIPDVRNKSETAFECSNYTFSRSIVNFSLSWYYQTCTEFGYYQTTDSNNQPFSKDLILNFFTELCLYFGPDFNEANVDRAVGHTNKLYGGLTPNVTKVVFVHGSVDPWHRLGITKSLSDDVPAVLIEGTTHGADILHPSPSDPEELTKARDYAWKMIKYWLKLGPRPAPLNE